MPFSMARRVFFGKPDQGEGRFTTLLTTQINLICTHSQAVHGSKQIWLKDDEALGWLRSRTVPAHEGSRIRRPSFHDGSVATL